MRKQRECQQRGHQYKVKGEPPKSKGLKRSPTPKVIGALKECYPLRMGIIPQTPEGKIPFIKLREYS